MPSVPKQTQTKPCQGRSVGSSHLGPLLPDPKDSSSLQQLMSPLCADLDTVGWVYPAVSMSVRFVCASTLPRKLNALASTYYVAKFY